MRPSRPATAVAGGRSLDVVDVAHWLAARPARRVVTLAACVALIAHLAAGAVGLGIRPARAERRVDVASVATAESVEPLADDVPPPPPPPRAPSPATSPSLPPTARPATTVSSAPPSSSSGPEAPVLGGVAGGVPGFGGVGAGSAQAGPVASTRPVATATHTAALTPARPLRRVAPRFPADARRDGRTGVVVVQLRVDEGGAVVDVRVVQSDPPGVFDAAAIESARAWTFTPATSDGHPVASWVRQTIRFTLEGT